MKTALELARKISIEIWKTYDDSYGYATEKINKCKEVSTDNPENFYFFFGQFDSRNQKKFMEKVIYTEESEERNWLLTKINDYIFELAIRQ